MSAKKQSSTPKTHSDITPPMALSVACNFDPDLPALLAPYPVYELYGKLTRDYFGGGRPSFYLPAVDRSALAAYVRKTHQHGMQFNYLLNSSAMANVEYTKEGQRRIDELLEWLDDIQVDAVTVANIYLLHLIKKRHPRIRVRVSSHRFTDNPRKVRFWADNGADIIVVSETNIHREFKVLEAMQRAAEDVPLSLIVNNWCRQDCAIAGNHAVTLSSASQANNKGFPLDYCSVRCNHIRLTEPVSYLRANWIRPEDLHLYEARGFHNFKIVERNTPTPILLKRVAAYVNRRYDGNLLDLVQNYAYPEDAFVGKAKDAYSLRRLVKYFVKPNGVNVFKLNKLRRWGKTGHVLYPRRGPNPVQIDNRALDGFLDRFVKHSCLDTACDDCRYCHAWAAKVVRFDAAWKTKMHAIYDDLLHEIDGGGMWEPHIVTVAKLMKSLPAAARDRTA